MRILAVLFFVLSLSMACKPTQQTVKVKAKKSTIIDKMNFRHNANATLTNVVDKANSQGKLIFVDIYTDWCTPCKMMDEDVFTDEVLTSYMKKHFVNYKVDGEKHNGPNLGVMYGVAGFPTLLILDQKGRILERHDGALYQTGLKAMAKRALDQSAL